MSAVVKLFGISRIVVRDSEDDTTNLLVLSAAEADKLAKDLRKAAREQREVSAYCDHVGRLSGGPSR